MSAASYLCGLEDCPLHKRTPWGIRNVSMTVFSVSRHTCGCTIHGEYYAYIPMTDELIRQDVLKWKLNRKPAAEKAEQKEMAL